MSEDKKVELVDCPRCQGFGYHPNGKLCLCCLEDSQGFTPGKLPVDVIAELGLVQPLYRHYEEQK